VQHSALDQFLSILTQPDNIPIIGMLVLVFFFTFLALREGRRNDQLIAQGREDEVLRRMQD
jgi:predicted PurR-regulated permease PerM